MMADAVCNLHTGLQGHGKTLLTIAHVEALRKRTGREVYYSGIRGLKLDWKEFGGPSKDPEKPWWTDPSEWFKLPTGAIIVIDEAQRLFRPRGNGSAVPDYEQGLEVLRHNGHTLFLITQDPTLLSANVRKLSGVHRHFMRKFGSKWCTVHEWAGVRDNVAKSRKDSVSTQLVYPKEFYDKYTSAEVHTVKFGMPLKVWLALLVPLVIGVLAWYVFWGRAMLRQPAPPVAGAAQPLGGVSSPQEAGLAGGGALSVARGKARPPQTPEALYASFQPRIPGLPHTAPRYDELTAPVRAPVVVGCWRTESGNEGWCITQQGTRLQMPAGFMVSFIERGQFVDFDPGPSLHEVRERSARMGTGDGRGPQSGG